MRKIILSLVVVCLAAVLGDLQVAVAKTASVPGAEHVVRRGQFLRFIADQHNVSWEAMLLANEDFLAKKYDQICGHLSEDFRSRRGDRGTRGGGRYYCNDRYNRPYGNSLRPGWRLKIPASSAPSGISTAISEVKGDKVAVVIDDTGSMTDDRQKVAEFYMAALRQYGKRLVGVWLYSDGNVRKYEAGGVKFLTSGSHENTFGALSTVAAEKPDAIVLVTDEPGDDWQWSVVADLPPVIAHCLESEGEYQCRENLTRLATNTHGRYMSGIM